MHRLKSVPPLEVTCEYQWWHRLQPVHARLPIPVLLLLLLGGLAVCFGLFLED